MKSFSPVENIAHMFKNVITHDDEEFESVIKRYTANGFIPVAISNINKVTRISFLPADSVPSE